MAKIKLNESARKDGIKAIKTSVQPMSESYRKITEKADAKINNNQRRYANAYQQVMLFIVS